jgi:hypothetical protein
MALIRWSLSRGAHHYELLPGPPTPLDAASDTPACTTWHMLGRGNGMAGVASYARTWVLWEVMRQPGWLLWEDIAGQDLQHATCYGCAHTAYCSSKQLQLY